MVPITFLIIGSVLTPDAQCSAGGDENWWDGFGPPPAGKGLNYLGGDLVVYDNVLIVGGSFTQAGNNQLCRRIGRFNGATWSHMQGGMDGSVSALLSKDGDLYAGGGFLQAGGTSANYIARWSSSAWHPVGSGMNDFVNALSTYGSDLVAGGWFTEADGQQCGLVAKWDGQAWSPIGLGMGGEAQSVVRDLKEYGGYLYAGGIFTTADGNPVTHLARWDGSAWSGFGTVIDGWTVRALSTDYGSGLLVGGLFSSINGVECNGLALWDGESWTGLGLGLGNSAEVVDIAIYNGDLIVLGYFGVAGHIQNIARWDGISWSSLGSGLTADSPFGGGGGLAAFNGDLYACGNIAEAGGKPSSFIARWTDSPPTSIHNFGSLSSKWNISVRNPALREALINYTVGTQSSVWLDICDARGRVVDKLVAENKAPGTYASRWSGVEANGAGVPSGMYFVRLFGNGKLERAAKVVLLR